VTTLIHKDLTFQIIGAAMKVHLVLGPGFLEAIYQSALERELTLREVSFVAQFHIDLQYKGATIADYYLDLVAENTVVLELKAVAQLAPIHSSQLLSYLNASWLPVGLLFNFGETSLKHKRMVL
jgi:GxxExxY protein